MTFDSLLPPGVSFQDAIVLMAGLASLSVVVLVWFALMPADPGTKRIKALADQRKAMKDGFSGPVRRSSARKAASTSLMHQVVDKFKLMKSTQASNVQNKLTKAGYRSKDALVRFFFFKLALPPVCGLVAVFLVYGLNVYPMAAHFESLTCLGAVVLGLYLPEIMVKNAAAKRQDKIRKSVPDCLDLMVICAEAGLSLDATLSRVSKELGPSDPEIADELTVTALELGFLPNRRTALKNLAARSDVSVMRGMANTLMQSEKYGTPLANSLRVMSAESRDERMMKAEEKVARLPAMMTVPMIIFILPPLFVVLIGPAALKTVDALSKM